MLKKIKTVLSRRWRRLTCNHEFTDCFPGAANSQMTQCCKKCGEVSMNPFFSKLYLR